MPTRRGKDGRWRYRKMVHLLDGSTMRISGTPDINTRLAAEAAERVHIERALKEAAMPGQTRKEVPTFGKFVEEQWLPLYPSSVGNRSTTVREKELLVRLYLKPAFGSLRLDAIRGVAYIPHPHFEKRCRVRRCTIFDARKVAASATACESYPAPRIFCGGTPWRLTGLDLDGEETMLGVEAFQDNLGQRVLLITIMDGPTRR